MTPQTRFSLALALAVFSASAAAAITPTELCSASKLKFAGKYALCSAKAAARSIRSGEPPDYGPCHDKLVEKFVVAETTAAGACLTTGDSGIVEN